MGNRLKSMSMRIDPGGEHHSVCIKSLVVVLQHMCSLKKCKSELCSNTRRDWSICMAHCIFQLFFQPPWCILVPSHHLLWKQREWLKTSQCQSLFWLCLLYHSSLFDVVGWSVKETVWKMTVSCDTYVKECFLRWGFHCHYCCFIVYGEKNLLGLFEVNSE